MATENTYANALIGAVVTVVFSFIPFSPIVGGGVAGFLEERDGAKIGAISGVMASVPLFLLVVVVGGFVAIVPADPGVAGGLVVLVFAVVLFLLLYTVGLSAVGGVLGVYLADEYRE